jgi:hypothetical protein
MRRNQLAAAFWRMKAHTHDNACSRQSFMADAATLIDRFVEMLNEKGVEPLFDKDVPPE